MRAFARFYPFPGVLLLFLVDLLISPGRPQACAQTTGDLDGITTDSANAPLPGVSLEARSRALQGVRETTSDPKGIFHFPVLPPGIYSVSARLPGFRPAAQDGVRVALGEAARLSITMILETSAEVAVSAEAPLIDTSSTCLCRALTATAISGLPLGRNYVAVASTVAGTGQDDAMARAGGLAGITVYGATGLENQFIIDGINTTGVRTGDQGKYLNQEFVQEVEVRTGSYEAEFGQVMGGNINVITKSGGNDFHSDVFGYYDSNALASADKHFDDRNAVNEPQPTLPQRLDAGLDLGGYFLKDKLWFFGAYDRVAANEDYQRVGSLTFPPSGPPISNLEGGTDRTRTNLFSGKLTLRAGPSHTLALSVFGDPTTADGRFTKCGPCSHPGPDSATLGARTKGGTDISAKWDGLFGSNIFVQAQYGYHEERNRTTSDFADSLSIYQIRQGSLQFAPNSGPPGVGDDAYRRNNYKLSGTAFLGSHEIKAGAFYEKLNSSHAARLGGGEQIYQYLDNTGAFEYAGHFYYAKVPLNCVARTNGTTGNFGFVDPKRCNGWEPAASISSSPRTANLAVFAQDSWKIAGNLTLNIGIRYEEQRMLDPEGNPAIKLTGQWSPRVGVVWDPLKNGRSRFFASYGRYYQVIPQGIQIRSLGNEAAVYAYNYTADKADNINTLLPFASVTGGDYVPPGIKGMYQDEVVGGVEYEFLKNWSFGVRGIYRGLGRAIEDRCDIYGDPRVQLSDLIPPSSLASCAVINVGEGQLGQISDPTNPDCFSDYPTNKQPTPCDSVKARRYFRGLQVDLQHRFADRFYLLASYLYSKLEGSYDGFVNQYFAQTAAGQNIDFDFIDLVPNDFGRLSLDRRHQLKLSGTYSFPFGLQAGINSFVFSGGPISLRGYSRPGYGPSRFLVPRGSYGQLPWTYSIDLHLEYPVRLGSVSIVPIVDVFNLTNVQQVTAVDEAYNRLRNGNQTPPYTNPTNPTFGYATTWQQPRLVRLGARVSF